MNFKYINRKQMLGTIHPNDYSDWASNYSVEAEEKGKKETQNLIWLYESDCTFQDSFTAETMQRTIQLFDTVIEELDLDFSHSEVQESSYTRNIQFIDLEARKIDLCFNIIDIRPIAEFGKDVGTNELLDKMVAECGCNPLGEYWINYSTEDGLQTLKTLFEREIVPDPSETTFQANDLAAQFLSYFDDTVCFFGNDCYAPWDEGYEKKTWVRSDFLQSSSETDFGLILQDSKHIGFLLLSANHH